uniref:RRM domain-containing protein n=1 Tax=Palpitomonas bilix TaxID=652834 RepID=A0A7S3G5T3_9EUKA|mmetsp:Transcript_31674/g.82670  ORF Transcript_31674/g.82670 Transcript_31674/m.82670 type:complete len:459 (+) Transcript_31674:65-1441(+)|eukprot:CAMPEP_0113889202 /NCGR_PEP_ID=MMETSP0780_2-20120614/13342_1 /TAXON_ID=652834 /ORGANISM="Palpitomonas bilix" /LENGTH=458 /DNA_ID=CAMNT_0000878227 /DNA_START=65 /DNA_END=1441 /DNA_ORIENTATION=- /assembly_acc=CAM_ASM_000599
MRSVENSLDSIKSGGFATSEFPRSSKAEQLRRGEIQPTLSASASSKLRGESLTFGTLLDVLLAEGKKIGLKQEDIDELLWLLCGEDYLDADCEVPWDTRREVLRLFPLARAGPAVKKDVRKVPRLPLTGVKQSGPWRGGNKLSLPPVEVDSYRSRVYFLVDGDREVEEMIDVAVKDNVTARDVSGALTAVPPRRLSNFMLVGSSGSALSSRYPSRSQSGASTPGLFVPVDSFAAPRVEARREAAAAARTARSYDSLEYALGDEAEEGGVPERGRNIVRVDALPHDASRQDVEALFEKGGYTVKRVIILHVIQRRQHITAGGHALAFVTLKDEDEARAAAKKLCGHTVCWRPVKVSLSSLVELLSALERREVEERKIIHERQTVIAPSLTLTKNAKLRLKKTPLPPSARPFPPTLYRKRRDSIGKGGASPRDFLLHYSSAMEGVTEKMSKMRGDRVALF